jgi:2-keto-4-pentenoate hydratase/2-oxohepta-3-ene-1,7-dioic acid hydratase in catechol pathway
VDRDAGRDRRSLKAQYGRLRQRQDALARRHGRHAVFFRGIIVHVTKDETLMPGEFIGSGTVGNGCGLELSWHLEHGHTMELDVEKIWVLKKKG